MIPRARDLTRVSDSLLLASPQDDSIVLIDFINSSLRSGMPLTVSLAGRDVIDSATPELYAALFEAIQ